MTRQNLRRLQVESDKASTDSSPRWTYRTAIAACDIGGLGSSGICYQAAVDACAGNSVAQGTGPLVDVFRMWVDQAGRPLRPPAGNPDLAGWIHIGTTCLPEMVPGAATMPTVAMILKAFHNTKWATAKVRSQPEGDTTLVNLRTFFRVRWEADGYQPGEVDVIDPATMFGYRVEIRPTLKGFLYLFGDGGTLGPTDSSGGTYPRGDIVHTYGGPGRFSSRVDVTFGGEFRINNGQWVAIPDTVTVRQPATSVTVREARAVLVQR
ncbi:hypothetical protein ACWEOW_08785 [Monashia sp. NPDC004114]